MTFIGWAVDSGRPEASPEVVLIGFHWIILGIFHSIQLPFQEPKLVGGLEHLDYFSIYCE